MVASATLGGGCFWCIEAAYKEVPDVHDVTSGYAGGETDDPTYREVCTGRTGHAEVVRITYDPTTIEYRELLEIFFTIHDPTQHNRQGPDVGSQYRSIILTESEKQREIASNVIEAFEPEFSDPIVTEVTELDTFYPAEEYHQDYFEKNQTDAYCTYYATPKVEKVKKHLERSQEIV